MNIPTTKLLIFSLVLSFFLFGCKDHDAHFSYEGKTGPACWGDLKAEYSACKNGKAQSPINITGPFEKTSAKLKFNYSSASLNVINNGHSIQVNYPGESTLIADGKEYKLLQFHFHTPSEGAINGKQSDMVAHLVHKSNDGVLAVVGVYFNIGKENKLIKTIWNNIPDKEGEEKNYPTEKYNPEKLLPKNKSYYSYMGSLTTPPCSEGVHWFILAKQETVSAEQVEKFKSIFPKSARPIQPLYGRKINKF